MLPYRNLILFLIIFCPSVFAFEFKDAGNEYVIFGGSSENTQELTMDENNPTNITVVLLSGASSNIANIVLNFLNGDESLFDHSVVKEEEDYAIKIGKSVDYETITSSGRFLVQVMDNGDSSYKNFNLKINNLDDEKPSFTTASCSMKENTTIDISNTDCAYTVSDPDGFLSKMNFKIIPNEYKNEDKIFTFQYKSPPSDNTYSADVYLMLQDGQVLDYETTTLHIFQLEATDSGGNPTTPSATVQIMVQVEDIPDETPVWTSFLYTSSFDEETPQEFQVSARDGDIGINSIIKYKIDDQGDSEFVQIDELTGTISVAAIDRDAGHDNIAFTIIAYETDDETSQCSQSVTFIINDIDDNWPEISIVNSDNDSITLDILENFSGTLNVEINIKDIDMSVNAMYTVSLEEENEDADYTSAFQVIPSRGYQETSFHLTAISSTMLNYENPDWQTIQFQIVATGDADATKTKTLSVLINLLDYNDESPTFDETEYAATIPEDIDINQFVQSVVATDDDAEDIGHVSHILLGTTANRILSIDEFSGNITTKISKAFDYERQTEIYVQIQAKDLANHTAITQLTIRVTDVNDENPTMSVSSSVSIFENQEENTILEVTVTAVDEDTTADLEFSINWMNSYATKNLIKLTDEEFEKAKFLTVKTDVIDNNNVNAILSTIKIGEEITPDYEIFDTLYLYLEVTDKNTESGSGTDNTIIVINVENLNDNEPIFSDDSISANRSISEFANVGSTIGSVVATDKDNLNELSYTIESADENTPDWIQIDNATGVLTVKDDVTLDCDDPPRYYLYYTITVTDGDYYTPLNISIYIIDQNDNKPVMTLNQIEILEDIDNGTEIYTFDATDKDRDDVYSDVAYSLYELSDSDITNRFKVNGNKLIVNLINSATLDRDHGQASFTCRITYKDNPTNFGSIQFTETADLKIVLLDVNDEVPTITTESISTRENLKAGDTVSDVINAVDDDEEGDNSKIAFTLNSIDKYEDSSYENIIGNVPETLFNVTTDENFESKQATLIVNENLENYYGYYMLHITTTDFGEKPLSKENDVKLEITKYNFFSPIFSFPPKPDSTYYLQIHQTPKYQLYLYDGSPFPDIQATDQQGDKYSITFSVTDESGSNLFQINNDAFPQSTGQLQLTASEFNVSTGNNYKLTITANNDKDSSQEENEASYTTDISVNLHFYDIESDPTFDDRITSGQFTEGEIGLNEQIVIPNATYPLVDIPDLPIYYLLKTGDATLFNVDINTGIITLKEELDYESQSNYELVIEASKDKTIDDDADPQSQLTVNIIVIDINDNPPVFSSSYYYGGIMSTYVRGTKIVEAPATDKDADDTLTYTIVPKSLQTHGDGISEISDPFVMDKNTGDISLNFVVQVNMNGYFTFNISVSDKDVLHTATAIVKIYIITEGNRVNFRFENILSKVLEEEDSIKAILDDDFNYQSNIEKIEPDVTSSGTDLDNQTVVSVYFINATVNEPVDQSVILNQVTDVTTFSKLRQAFLEHTLILMSFQDTSDNTENLEEILKAWLIGVSVVLGALCLILLVTYILKIRSLNQRINNLSTTKFGSQESGLNRQGVTAPTTNKHAIEGSNPVFNNEIDTKEIDQISVASGDSDLIGIENNPEFDYDSYENDKKDIIS